jgi:hypothetical protein
MPEKPAFFSNTERRPQLGDDKNDCMVAIVRWR